MINRIDELRKCCEELRECYDLLKDAHTALTCNNTQNKELMAESIYIFLEDRNEYV